MLILVTAGPIPSAPGSMATIHAKPAPCAPTITSALHTWAPWHGMRARGHPLGGRHWYMVQISTSAFLECLETRNAHTNIYLKRYKCILYKMHHEFSSASFCVTHGILLGLFERHGIPNKFNWTKQGSSHIFSYRVPCMFCGPLACFDWRV